MTIETATIPAVMADLSLDVRTRDQFGRHVTSLRRSGEVPAVLYGHARPPVALSANLRQLERLWRRAGRTHLIELRIDGGRPTRVLIKDLQTNPRTNQARHVDFFAVNLREKLTADVPVVITGTSPAVEEENIGMLQQVISTLKVESLPQDLPAQLSVDVSGLRELDQGVSVSEIELPHGVTLVHTEAAELVVKVAAFRVSGTEEEAEAAEAGTEAAEAGTEASEESAGGASSEE